MTDPAPPVVAVLRTAHWRLDADGGRWLLTPARPVGSLADLDDGAAAALGPLLRRAVRDLERASGGSVRVEQLAGAGFVLCLVPDRPPGTGAAAVTGPGRVTAPFHGTATVLVAEGQRVLRGQVVARVEAMKMEAVVTAPIDGTVVHAPVRGTRGVDGGDLLLLLG